MKWSLKLGRFLGVDVFLHVTFLLFLAWLGYGAYVHSGSLAAGMHTVTFIASVFGCVLLHEYGHVLMARKFGIGTQDITLLPIGGVARLDRSPSDPKVELLVAVAGPAVNVALALIIAIWLKAEQMILPSEKILFPLSRDFLANLFRFNVFMLLFNLLPAFPMDGGRVLRAVLAMKLSRVKATRIAATVGQGMAILFVVAALVSGREMLLLIALFVWVGASREAEDEEEKFRLSGIRAGDAMMTDFHRLTPTDTAADAVRLFLQGWQADFPVVDGDGCLVGLVTRQDLVGKIDEPGGPAQLVTAFMKSAPPACGTGESLDIVMDRLFDSELPLMHVTEDGVLRGLISTDSVMRALRFRGR